MAVEKQSGGTSERATHDLYYTVHKGIRLAHGRILAKLGSADLANAEALAQLAADIRHHMAMCADHLKHEDAEIHVPLEARRPGGSEIAADGHDHHHVAFQEIETLTRALETADPADRAAAGRRLYQRFAVFVADDLKHMNDEETLLMPLLQEAFTDDELAGFEHRIVSSIDPQMMTAFMRPMLAAMRPDERRQTVEGMAAGMPTEAFGGLMGAVVGKPWQLGDWRSLETALV